MSEPKPVPQYVGTPRHLRTPEFAAYLQRAAVKGGKSRSLAKLDAARRNGRKGGKKGNKPGPKGPQMKVPPLNAPEVYCVKRCGFSMLLSQQAMELNTRGKPITLTCPDCGEFGVICEARTCESPVMPARPV